MKNYQKFALAGAFVAASFIFVFLQFFNNSSSTDFQNTAEQSIVENNAPAELKAEEQAAAKQKIAENYGRLPLHFEPNLGQTDESVKFTARGHGYSLFLTETEAILALQKRGKDKSQDKQSVVRMEILGVNSAPKANGLGETEGKSNYFIGNDAEKWRTEVPNFKQVKYESVYEGVDLVYYGNNQQLEYDFLVQPNANPNQIRLKFDGVKSAKIEAQSGDLLLETEVGTLRQHAPVVYQNIDGERREIASTYNLLKEKGQTTKDEFTVSFKLADYDKTEELIIDPILAYGSYLGGNLFDQGGGIAVDAAGNAYIVGTSASRDFPTTAGVIKPTLLPRTDSPNSFWYDAFVTKVNPTGTALVFSTYFGGRNGNETGGGVTVDANGNVLFSGITMASDFPTVNAYQTTFGGTDDGFAVKLNSTGSAIIYSTYLGGNNTDIGGRIALDQATGDAVFVGSTSSPNFPTTPGAFKEKLCDSPVSCSGIFYSGSYMVKLSANGNAIYSTLFNAGIADVALDASNNAVIGGTASLNAPTTPGAFQTVSSGGIDGYIAKMNPAGNTLVFGTFLGGGLQSDRVKGIALDAAGNIYAAGQTENTGFPVTPGAFDVTFNGNHDGFLTKFNPAGSALVYSTFFGGQGKDEPFALGLGTDNSAFIAGETLSGINFPLRNSINGTNGTIFLLRFNPDASALVFSTLLGQGGAYAVAVDGANNAYITGHTTSIPVTPDSFQPMKGEPTSTGSTKDAFVMKIAPADETIQAYSISGTVTDPTQFGNYQPIVVTVTGTVSRSIVLPYGSGNGIIPFFFGNLPAGGNYTVTARKAGFETEPESVTFNNLGANQFADFTILTNQEPIGVITTPTHGATFNAPASINIQATASDPDGHAIQKVDFVAYHSTLGSIPLGTDTTAPYEFTWENVPVGTWALYAYPTDELGLRGDSTPTVHVFVVDPTGANVSITSPTEGQAFIQGDFVPITVSVSSSVNLVEVRDQNNNMVARMTQSPWTTQWRVMETGNYTLTAKAFTQTNQQATSAPVSFTVNPINHRISGRIVDSITGSPVSDVTLNLTSPSNGNISAQATTDSNGVYLFTGLGATPNDGVVITPAASGFTFEPQSKSIAYLGFIDWNNQNFTAVPQTQITVALTSPTEGQIFSAPATINLAANATSGAGAITRVDFYRNLGASTELVGSDTEAPYEFAWSGVAAGFYGVFARATDSTGAVADSEAVSVRVNAPTTTIRLQGDITNPGGGWMQGITVQLEGTVNGNPINQTSISNSFGAYGFFNLPAGGNYTITPQGAGGMTFTPPSFSVTNATQDNYDIDFVASATNQAPSVTINSPSDGATFTMPAAIPINVTSADADGTVAHLSVSAQGNSTFTTIGQSNNGTLNFLWQPNLPGSYTLWAEARDNGGLRTTVSINITVNPPAPVSISGRIVDRASVGIEGVTVELKDYPAEDNVIATATTDVEGRYTIPNVATFTSYILRASKLNYTFAPQQRIYFNLNTSQTLADFTGTLQVQPSDFDGDGETDAAVWRPSTGIWYVKRSTDDTYTALQFGGASFGDVIVPGNYDGDQKIDYGVFRNGIWYLMNSSNGQVKTIQFGFASDKPVPGDYDGDGKTDVAVWRPETGVWYIQRSSDAAYDIRQFGLNGDVPLVGDYDGDGKTDLTVWRPSTGVWYVLQSTDGNFRAYQFGVNGDTPLVGDFDGDKMADYTIFRPSTGVWYVHKSSDSTFKILQWGISTDMPVPGDFDRDGKTDFAVFRKTEGNWYIFKSTTNSYVIQKFGMNGDMPVPAAFVQ